MKELIRIFRFDHGPAGLGDVQTSRFGLLNLSQIESIEEYKAPLLFEGSEADKPKTQIDFFSGKKIIVRGGFDEIDRFLGGFKKEVSMGLENSGY